MDERKAKLFEIVEQARAELREYILYHKFEPSEWARKSGEYSMVIKIISELKLEEDFDKWLELPF